MIHVAIAVVQDAEDRFLVGMRPAGTELAGHHEFPGGKIEPGESALAAAVRECAEETGIDIAISERLHEVEHEYDHGRLRLEFFLATSVAASTTPRPPYAWVPRRALADCSFPAANAKIVAALVDGVH